MGILTNFLFLQPRNMMLSLPVRLLLSRSHVCWVLVWTRLASSLALSPILILWFRKLKKSRVPSSSRWRRYIE